MIIFIMAQFCWGTYTIYKQIILTIVPDGSIRRCARLSVYYFISIFSIKEKIRVYEVFERIS